MRNLLQCALIIVECLCFAHYLPDAALARDAAARSAAALPSPSGPPLTEREKQLVERIDALERRIAALEARDSGKPANSAAATADPPASVDSVQAAASMLAGGFERTATRQVAAIEVKQRSASPVKAQWKPSASQLEAAAPEKEKPAEPFAFADFTWLNGNSRTSESPLDTKVFTGEFRVDTSYIYDFNHPKDHTLVGTTESGRTNEVQVQQLGIGGDFHYDHIRGRLITQFGMYSSMTPRNDPTPGRGQWNLDVAYRYLSEAYGGYHFDALHGINVDAGIFMSYVGLFSYYNFDNWAYQPSYVSSNTPWFFNGVRVQLFPTEKLKIEPWVINGWQSYGTANGRPGLGLQVLWRPNGAVSILGNQYAVGRDTLGAPSRTRFHTDDSIEVKYYDNPASVLDKSAFSLTLDAGCESGSGVSCFGNSPRSLKQSFLGFMAYNRCWFRKNLFGLTLGGGAMNNPGRYLVLLPPINGATAFSGTPYFTENPGDPFKAWDASATFDYMPKQFVTFRLEFDHRAANVPYFAGPGGVTPPGGNTGPAGSVVPDFTPDLRKRENRLNLAVLVKL
jgi:hypothetical protein